MIIWGSRGREKEISSGQFYCPNCRTQRTYKFKQVGKYFTLYFIPLFETKKLGEYVECQYCKQAFKPDVLNYKPPTNAEHVLVALRGELESGMPLHMARQKLIDAGADSETALQIVAVAAGDNPNTCPKCGFMYRSTVTTCPNCGTELRDEDARQFSQEYRSKIADTAVSLEASALLNRDTGTTYPPRHLTSPELANLTFRQRSAVREYGYLLSPEDAETVGKMLGSFRDEEAKKFIQERGTEVTYSE